MTGEEIHRQYLVPYEIIEEYRSFDLWKGKDKNQFDDSDLQKISLVMILHNIGFIQPEVESYLRLVGTNCETGAQRLHMLENRRRVVLDEIHEKEKQLMRIDDLRYELMGTAPSARQKKHR